LSNPNPFNCFRASCDGFVTRVVEQRIYHVCGECALIINSIVSCPKEDPTCGGEIGKKKKSNYKEQSSKEMAYEIKKADFKRKYKVKSNYYQDISKLLEEYK
jgi:hypothetical protein